MNILRTSMTLYAIASLLWLSALTASAVASGPGDHPWLAEMLSRPITTSLAATVTLSAVIWQTRRPAAVSYLRGRADERAHPSEWPDEDEGGNVRRFHRR